MGRASFSCSWFFFNLKDDTQLILSTHGSIFLLDCILLVMIHLQEWNLNVYCSYLIINVKTGYVFGSSGRAGCRDASRRFPLREGLADSRGRAACRQPCASWQLHETPPWPLLHRAARPRPCPPWASASGDIWWHLALWDRKAPWIPEGPADQLRSSGCFAVPPLPNLLPLPPFGRVDP